jgi:hypothetical protein
MKSDQNKDVLKNNSEDKNYHTPEINKSALNEERAEYVGFVHKSEDQKLREDIFRTPTEKFHLFTQMLRREFVLRNARIIKP